MTYDSPTLDASCNINTVAAILSNCASDDTVELSDIEEVIFDEKSTQLGIPKNPISGWVNPIAKNTNEASILTWIATADQTAAGKLKRWSVIADKPAPEKVTVNMPQSKTYDIGKTYVLNITRPLGDHTGGSLKLEQHIIFGTQQTKVCMEEKMVLNVSYKVI
jgi:hypothetical protein